MKVQQSLEVIKSVPDSIQQEAIKNSSVCSRVAELKDTFLKGAKEYLEPIRRNVAPIGSFSKTKWLFIAALGVLALILIVKFRSQKKEIKKELSVRVHMGVTKKLGSENEPWTLKKIKIALSELRRIKEAPENLIIYARGEDIPIGGLIEEYNLVSHKIIVVDAAGMDGCSTKDLSTRSKGFIGGWMRCNSCPDPSMRMDKAIYSVHMYNKDSVEEALSDDDSKHKNDMFLYSVPEWCFKRVYIVNHRPVTQ